ncbi:MAG: hypothetical protein COA78_01175 [Blastopirellula sp.]|nr:MAG: hypothetical protein COA78_01175 [Blastopirellula sp.]
MIHNKSLQRKIIYFACMIPLFLVLIVISRPETGDDAGGILAQQRKKHGIAQTNIGELDPASEAMRLSMMGLDGIATVVMWMKVHEYQREEKYSNVEALCKRITQVNPHFLAVWEFQAWNLSYNVSREFDNYEHRYLWVKKGANYQMEGTRYNYDQPKLMAKISEFFGMKIGMSDEKAEFRLIFPEDDTFHKEIDAYFVGSAYSMDNDSGGVNNRPDNWLVARMWSLWANELADAEPKKLGNASPAIFHSTPTKRLMSFAEVIEKEGHIGELAKIAWTNANDDWVDFGNYELTSSWGIPFTIREYDTLVVQVGEKQKEFDEFTNNLRATMRDEKFNELTPAEQKAIETDEFQRTEEQESLAYEAERKLIIPLSSVVLELEKGSPEQLNASRLAREINALEFRTSIINTQRNVVHYDYWDKRSESEGQDNAIKGRQLVYDAHKAFNSANLVEARKLYEEAWPIWRGIYDDYPVLASDSESGILANSVKEYRELLNQLDEDITPDFPLLMLLQMHDDRYVPPKAVSPAEPEPTPADPKAADPKAAKPEAAKPEAAKPEAAKPEAAEPEAAEKPDDAKATEASSAAPKESDASE